MGSLNRSSRITCGPHCACSDRQFLNVSTFGPFPSGAFARIDCFTTDQVRTVGKTSTHAAMSTEESIVVPSTPMRPDELEKIRNEEYKIWKKQSPFLYDICITKAMTSPSASVQWFPATDPWTLPTNSHAFKSYSLLLTSSELLGGSNSAIKAKCDLPTTSAKPDEICRYSSSHCGLQIVTTKASLTLLPKQFPFYARYSHLNPERVACCGKDGFVKVFNGDHLEADLVHHTGDVFDLSWSPYEESQLVSAGTDGSAALWNLESPSAPAQVFAGDNSVGNSESVSQPLYSIQFAPLNQNEVAAAGDGRVIQIWDLRAPLTKPRRIITDENSTGITALNYSPLNEMLLATGSTDGAISIWDVRMCSASLIGLHASTGPINSLKWSPLEESVLATGGSDAQVKVWDLSMHGQVQTPAEEEEGPPELIFIHGGHLGAISDLDWHPTLPWTLCSVSEDSIVGIWKIASSIVDAVDFNGCGSGEKDAQEK